MNDLEIFFYINLNGKSVNSVYHILIFDNDNTNQIKYSNYKIMCMCMEMCVLVKLIYYERNKLLL